MPYEIIHRSVSPEVDGYVTLCSFLLEFWSNSHRGAYIRQDWRGASDTILTASSISSIKKLGNKMIRLAFSV